MVRELKTLSFWRAVLAEVFGTTLLVFSGISASIGNGNSSYPDQEVKVALAFGLAIAVLSQSITHVSGAHLNPAVSLGMLVSCQISVVRAMFYIVAQMLGAVLGSGVVLGVRPEAVDSLGLNKVSCWIQPSTGGSCLLSENNVCFVFIDEAAVCLFVFPFCLFSIYVSFTGCGINPARSFGPALVTLKFENHWVFWAGPLCGGAVAAVLYDFLLSPRGADFTGRLKVWCHGLEALVGESEPLLEGEGGESAQK
uniref:Aquaporin 1a (Colton blood group), tandem duplicate 2 n=1 Tax=Astyanax mexicanus TaxID=7994 RepID=A0A8B9KP43_ASTMX